MKPNSITVAILCKNSEATLENTLKSVAWAENILILDDGSTDNSVSIAKRYTKNVQISSSKNFAAKRNEAKKLTQTDWILYIDADEVVTPKLRDEIISVTKTSRQVYRLTRTNYFLGTPMYPDQVERLFPTGLLKKWHGDVHETPEFSGNVADLKSPLLHYTHRDITSMLEKTNEWSEIEAKLRLDANHPPVAWWRLIRIAITESWHQLVNQKVFQYGRAGWFEGYFQVIDKLIVYVKLWEKQQ